MSQPTLNVPRGTDLPGLALPETYGYMAAFLTLACNLHCSYCINWFNSRRRAGKSMSAADWVRGLNRLASKPDLPVTLQGGEPSLHPGFYEIITGLREDLAVDVLTNLQFDVEEFMARVPASRVRRAAPYASIRVSYHPETMDLAETKAKVLRLLARGYSVGIWAVRHPSQIEQIERARDECVREGIDFRFKEFLGEHEGKLYGKYKYPDAVTGRAGSPVQCRTTELILGPTGHVYACHSHLYNDGPTIGHILDRDFVIEDAYRACDAYGLCNPCDVKVKTNRFQQEGHTSVTIRTCSHS